MLIDWIRTLLIIFLILGMGCAISYYWLAERVLRDFRQLYPTQWENAGHPTFLSSAIWGRGYWKPVSADNFFRYRRYLSLSDSELIQRAEGVRKWQSALYVLCIIWVILAGTAVLLSR